MEILDSIQRRVEEWKNHPNSIFYETIFLLEYLFLIAWQSFISYGLFSDNKRQFSHYFIEQISLLFEFYRYSLQNDAIIIMN